MTKGSIILLGFEVRYDICPKTKQRSYYLFGRKFKNLIQVYNIIKTRTER
jgi:uncharacterized membrane protein